MSTALALAATTAVIRKALGDGIASAIAADSNLGSILGAGTPPVTSLPPDRVDPVGVEALLNLFLFEVTYNAGYENAQLPVRNGRGERISTPPLALDLHYLLTAYGSGDLVPEILLGLGMQLLHETPFLSRDQIRGAFTPVGGPLTALMKLLATSGLADQAELIKISPHPMIKVRPQPLSNDDLSKLWASFQERYRLTTAYLVTVVLIDTRASARSPLPVLRSNLAVTPLRRPVIATVEPPAVAVAPGATITLNGLDLLGEDTVVSFGSGQSPAPAPGSTGSRLKVAVPPDLQAGVNTVRVVERLTFGTTVPHPGFGSNVASLLVSPTIASTIVGGDKSYSIVVTNATNAGPDLPRSADLAITLIPAVAKAQAATLLLNQVSPPAADVAASYSFDAESRADDPGPTSPVVRFKATGLVPGGYIVRVRVDGAESVLEVDANGRYFRPSVTIP